MKDSSIQINAFPLHVEFKNLTWEIDCMIIFI